MTTKSMRCGVTIDWPPCDSRGSSAPRYAARLAHEAACLSCAERTAAEKLARAVERESKNVRELREEETRWAARIDACFRRAPATAENPCGGHRLRSLSHEEAKCAMCGEVFFTPDL
jgi:hypothetical protein